MTSFSVHNTHKLTGHNAAIYTLIQGRNEKEVISAGGDGWVVSWNLDDPEIGKLIAKVDGNIFSLCRLNQTELVVGNMHGGLHWLDLSNPTATKNIAHHQKGVFDILKIGDFVYTLGGEGMLTRWSAAEKRSLESFHLTNKSLRSLDYSLKRNELVIGASDSNIYFLDANTLELKNSIRQAHDNSVFTVQYSPDNTYLLSGGRDAHLKVWDLQSIKKPISSQPAHWFTINNIVFHPSAPIFATASRDKTIRLWDAKNFQLITTLDWERHKGHLNSVNKLLWSSAKNQLISCSDDRSLIIWDISFE